MPTKARGETDAENMCKYGREKPIEYLDNQLEPKMYECPRKAEIDGYCILHHPHHWKEKPDDVCKRLYEDVKSQKQET